MASLNTDVRATWRDAAHKAPDEIEHDIDDTRADVQATLEALEHKLSPNRLLDMTLDRVREHGGEIAGNLGHAVKENPVPLLLTSIGIAWMMMSSRHDGNGYALRSGDTGNGHRWRDRLHGAQDRWSDTKQSARERMSGMKESMSGVNDTLHGAQEDARAHLAQSRETLSHAAASVRDTARRAGSATRVQLDRARSSADYLMQEQPLVLGAIGLAAGALIGAALPATAEEDRLMGSARDRTLDQAKRAGEEGYRRVRDRAEELATQAESKLRGDRRSDNGSTRHAEHEDADTEWPTDRAAPQSSSTTSAGRGSSRSSKRRDGSDRDESSEDVPSSAWASGTDDSANQSSERKSDEVPNFGENPTQPRHTKRRASERGVGREHASDSFTTPDQSPTSKTPPL